jgi:BirA family biotin operon repressor/biotin-[acetyl-CoA-carboxylase] ligase
MQATVHHIDQTTSTQIEARRLIADGHAEIGDIVVADEQTAGRGRFGRTWVSPSGGLYATMILSADPLISLKAGLAVARSLRSVGINAGLKWPNDVLVEGRKIAGVLVENDGGQALVGIGLNLTSAPLDTATCTALHSDMTDRDEWARTIAEQLMEISSGNLDLDEYRSVCLTLGCSVRIAGVDADSLVEGKAVDVDEQGRLVVQTRAGKKTISSGECLHLRESESKQLIRPDERASLEAQTGHKGESDDIHS